MQAIEREILPDGGVRLSSGSCTYIFTRFRQDALLMTVTGNDAGEFGTAVVDEVQRAFCPQRPLALYIDIKDAVGAAPNVTELWIGFLLKHAQHLSNIDVLVLSRVLELTVAVVKHFSRSGNLIRIHSDPQLFDALVGKAGGTMRHSV